MLFDHSRRVFLFGALQDVIVQQVEVGIAEAEADEQERRLGHLTPQEAQHLFAVFSGSGAP
jgi:hypothetical protein